MEPGKEPLRSLSGMIPYASHRSPIIGVSHATSDVASERASSEWQVLPPPLPLPPLPLKRVSRLFSLPPPSSPAAGARLCRRCCCRRRRLCRLCSSSWVRNQAAWEHFRELTRPPVDRRSVAEKERISTRKKGTWRCFLVSSPAHDAHKDGDCGRRTDHDVRLARD